MIFVDDILSQLFILFSAEMRSLVSFFSSYEDVNLIYRFHQHPFFDNFNEMSDLELKDYLVQRWFLSLDFVPRYDRAILALQDEEAKQILKKIVQDETPIGAPSHREDLLADLEFIGIPKSKVLTAKPTRETRTTLYNLGELVKFHLDEDNDLRIMAALWTVEEKQVAEEYRHVVPELERRFGLTPDRSRFYAPHFYHDRKDGDTGQHTLSFGSFMDRKIDSEEKLEIAITAAEKAFEAKNAFYNQFLPDYIWKPLNKAVSDLIYKETGERIPVSKIDAERDAAFLYKICSDDAENSRLNHRILVNKKLIDPKTSLKNLEALNLARNLIIEPKRGLN